jgi:hypothetical protein
MNKILVVALIGLLMAVGLVLTGCMEPGANCSGSGECTVTIDQGTNGLYVDNNSPRSSCGDKAIWDSNLGDYSGGCNVQNNIDGISRKYGTHSCNC